MNRLLPGFAGFEVLLAVGLLMSYRYAYVASILAGLTMVAIIAVNLHAFDVLFRNVGIACGAFALAAQCPGRVRRRDVELIPGRAPTARVRDQRRPLRSPDLYEYQFPELYRRYARQAVDPVVHLSRQGEW